jgi:hypothetical protein
MRTWTNDGVLVTRRVYERRLDEVFGSSVGGRVMTWTRNAGLVRTGKQGPSHDRPLLPRERAALILTSALICGTNLTLDAATKLIVRRPDWIRNALAVAVTGEDLVLHHTVGRALTVEVTIRNAVLRDPEVGVGGMELEMAA